MFMGIPLITAGYGWGWYPTETEIKNQSERRKFENRVATERRVVEDLSIRERKTTMVRRIHLPETSWWPVADSGTGWCGGGGALSGGA